MERIPKSECGSTCHPAMTEGERVLQPLEETKEPLECSNAESTLQFTLNCNSFSFLSSSSSPIKQSEKIIPITNLDSLINLLHAINVILF